VKQKEKEESDSRAFHVGMCPSWPKRAVKSLWRVYHQWAMYYDTLSASKNGWFVPDGYSTEGQSFLKEIGEFHKVIEA
jgi:hypothetical protein